MEFLPPISTTGSRSSRSPLDGWERPEPGFEPPKPERPASRVASLGREETDRPSGEPEEDRELLHRKRIRVIREWLVILVIALGAAFSLRTWVLEAFYVPSGSMEPTLDIGDRILVDKLAYDFSSIHLGDIIVFHRPPRDTVDPGIADLVKRVIGLPGQYVSFGPPNTDEVFVNGKLISQPWEPPGTVLGDSCPTTPQYVPPGYVFVMGDNRASSYDSRCFGPVSEKLIVGKVIARIWPPSRIHWFGL